MSKAIAKLSFVLFFLPLLASDRISINLRVYNKEPKIKEYKVNPEMKVSKLKEELLDKLAKGAFEDLITGFVGCGNLYCGLLYFEKKTGILSDLKSSKKLSDYGIKEGSILDFNVRSTKFIDKNPEEIIYPLVFSDSTMNDLIYPSLNLEESFDREIQQRKELNEEVKDDFLKSFIKRILKEICLFKLTKELSYVAVNPQRLIWHIIEKYPHLCNEKFTSEFVGKNLPLMHASLISDMCPLLFFLIQRPEIKLEAKNSLGFTILYLVIFIFLNSLNAMTRTAPCLILHINEEKKYIKTTYLNLIKQLLEKGADPNVIAMTNPISSKSLLEQIIEMKDKEPINELINKLINEILKSTKLKTHIREQLAAVSTAKTGDTRRTGDTNKFC